MRRAKQFVRRSRRGAILSVLAALVAVCFVAGALVAVPARAGASEASDRAQMAQLEQHIASDGSRIQSLVARQNDVQARLDTLNAEVARDQARLTVDQRAEDASLRIVRQVAVRAYTGGDSLGSSMLGIFDGSADITTLLSQAKYLGALDTKLSDALMSLRSEQARANDDREAVRTEQQQAQSSLADLAARAPRRRGGDFLRSRIAHAVNGNLRTLISARQKAEQAQAERQLAARGPRRRNRPFDSLQRRSPFPHRSSSPPPPPPSHVASNGYANPLRAIAALTPERIDQGVDYAGIGPIYAVGNGVVLSTSIPGWPGGTYIAYQLSDGPAAGRVVYAAEDIEPSVQPGQQVDANTVLGQVYAGPDGIETGWGDPTAIGNTMARTYGQFSGGNSTAFGANFSRLLQSLGAPGGILQNNPPTGSLPGGWPSW